MGKLENGKNEFHTWKIIEFGGKKVENHSLKFTCVNMRKPLGDLLPHVSVKSLQRPTSPNHNQLSQKKIGVFPPACEIEA